MNAQQFVANLRAYLAENQMITPGKPLGVAVSGGADSVCLLFAMRAALAEANCPLHILHVNHRLRGQASDDDENFVRQIAATSGLPVQVTRASPGSVPETGVEEWAREQRLAFFAQMRRELGLQAVAAGHTRRDQAETVLLRLFRGAGTRGLGGIAPVNAMGVIHPLLWASREQVLSYLEEQGLAWREDDSNQDLRFTRNALRLRWIPALAREFNPNLESALASAALLLREDSAALDAIAGEHRQLLFRESRYGQEAKVADFAGIPPALARRAIAQTAAPYARKALDFQDIERICRMLGKSSASGSFQTSGILAERSGPWFRIAPLERELQPEQPRRTILVRNEDASIVLPGLHLLLQLRSGSVDQRKPNEQKRLNSGYTEGWSSLDPVRLCFPLGVRLWRDGDAYRPVSVRSKRKLKELFQRHGIPRWRRRHEVVLESNGEIVWSRSCGPSHSAVAGDSCLEPLAVRVMEISITGNPGAVR